MGPARRRSFSLAIAFVLLTTFGACSGADADRAVGDGGPSERLAERIEVVSAHVEDWAQADTIEEARAAAEAAANHIVGPKGPGYGDRDNDGRTRGPTDAGILPGLDGEPEGFALGAGRSDTCMIRDVLGGTWDAPQERWQEMAVAIEGWSPSNNTMPSLASHPMRVVGWATFALATDSLDLAHEYAGHARLHVDISREALDCP